MKTVCYTALVGNYDTLHQPRYVSRNWDYVCFTDQPLKRHRIWEIRPLQRVIDGDVIRTSRWHKMHPHLLFPEYDNSVYIDCNIQITGSHLESRLKQFIENGTFIALPPHPERHCVYDEVIECIRTDRDRIPLIQDMERFLRKENFPPGRGLFENNLVFRRHTDPKIIRIAAEWWDLIRRYSHRDQLSLTYLLWKHRIDAELLVPIGETIRNYPGYRYRLHKHLIPPPQWKTHRRRWIRFLSRFLPLRRWRHAVRNA
jgi:hypothetical protein